MEGHFKLVNYENIDNDIITNVTKSNDVKVRLISFMYVLYNNNRYLFFCWTWREAGWSSLQWLNFFTVKMMVLRSFESSVAIHRHNILDNLNLQQHCCENLKSCMITLCRVFTVICLQQTTFLWYRPIMMQIFCGSSLWWIGNEMLFPMRNILSLTL